MKLRKPEQALITEVARLWGTFWKEAGDFFLMLLVKGAVFLLLSHDSAMLQVHLILKRYH
jgi:hypothetical protein